MHLFSVIASACPANALACWYDMGFRPAASDDETGPSGLPAQPDVFLTFQPTQAWWEELKQVLPRCFVLRGTQKSNIPAGVTEIYELAEFRLASHEWLLGWKMPAAVKLPNMNRAAKTECEQLRAVADIVYQVLLDDTFRETAEWCGHMSSVVRPL